MEWKIGEAKQKFSEVIRSVVKEPQIIYNRDEIVAAIIDAHSYNEYVYNKLQLEKQTLAERFRSLRELCSAEDYELIIPERKNRDVQF